MRTVAVAKILGLETEYGITVRGTPEINPIAASSTLISSYLASIGQRNNTSPGPVLWDYQSESPGRDARDTNIDYSALIPQADSHLVNTVLTNGARFYVDHAHPEISLPECRDALSATLYDRGAEMIMAHAMEAANEVVGEGREIVTYKNNSDGKGNSYGCHENYLLDRRFAFRDIAWAVIPHLVSRQIYTGAGKVGAEHLGLNHGEITFQLTQRADFFEEVMGLETTLKRPLVNTRDEPHADPTKYRRLHLITGDANMAQLATFLKLGTTALVLAMFEDGYLAEPLTFQDPVTALRTVSYDLTLKAPLRLDNGTELSALEIQWLLFEKAVQYVQDFGSEATGSHSTALLLEHWERVLSGLEHDPDSLIGQLDWPTKLSLLKRYRDRDNLSWDSAQLAAISLQYHDLRPEKSLAARLGLYQLVDDEAAAASMTNPPEDTRAYFRGECLRKFPDAVVAANWDSVVIDLGAHTLRKIPMLEPSRGTKDHVEDLLRASTSPQDLVNRLAKRA